MIMWHVGSYPLIVSLVLLPFLFTLMLVSASGVVAGGTMVLEWEVFAPGSLVIGFPVVVDWLSLSLSLTVLFISFSVAIFSVSYMSGDPNLEYFMLMVGFFVLSMNLLVFIPSLLFLLLGWDGLGLTSYLLVIYYQNDSSLSAGMVTALTNRVGDALLILAGAWSFSVSHWMEPFTVFGASVLLGLALVGAAMTKSAQLPFSAWLPAAMAAPTPVSSLVHSSTLVTAGVYLLIRFYSTLSSFWFFTPFMFFTGVLTCTMAGLAANYEYDLKKVIALSTLSQLGVMMLSIGLGQPVLAFFHLLAHALFKALLFVCAGTIIHANGGVQDMRLLGNLWNSMPVTCAALNTANLALCGLPFLAGFYSKDSIVESWLMSSLPLLTSVLLVSSVCLTGAYSFRMSWFTLWFTFKGVPLATGSDEGKFNHSSFTGLFIGAVMGGAALSWMILPALQIVVLPLQMKTLALMLILSWGAVSCTVLVNKWRLPTPYWMTSMWFMGLITSAPQVNKVLSFGGLGYVNEFSWLEYLGGGFAVRQGPFLAQSLLRTQWVSFSSLLHLTALVVAVFVWGLVLLT